PIVHVDFGKGNVITRTLHGNIATYVCTAEGEVLDVLPGIYVPDAYVAQLEQLRLLARYVDQDGRDHRHAKLIAYHRDQAVTLGRGGPANVLKRPDASKAAIERNIKVALRPGTPSSTERPNLPADLTAIEDVAQWKELAEDTRVNERVRRRLIHELLSKEHN